MEKNWTDVATEEEDWPTGQFMKTIRQPWNLSGSRWVKVIGTGAAMGSFEVMEISRVKNNRKMIQRLP